MTNEQHIRAKFLLQSKKYKDGLAYVKGLLAASPQDDVLHAFLALFYQGLMNMSEAEKSIIQAIRLNPTEFLHYKNASKIQLLSENPEKADGFISSALKLNPEDSDLFAFKGAVYISRREYNKAVQVTNKGLKLDPNNSQNLRTKALALSFLNEQKDAEEISRGLLNNDPINAQNLLIKGIVSLNDSKKTSTDELRASLALQPNNPHIQNAFRLSLRSELSGFLRLQNWSIGMGKSDSGPSVFVQILYVLFALLFIIISLFEGIKNVWFDLYLGFWNMNLVIQLSVFIYLPLYDTWLFLINKESRALFDKKLKLKMSIVGGFIVGIISLSILGITYNSIQLYQIVLHISTLLILVHQIMHLKQPYTWIIIYLVFVIICFGISIYQFEKNIYLFIASNIIFRILSTIYHKLTHQRIITLTNDKKP